MAVPASADTRRPPGRPKGPQCSRKSCGTRGSRARCARAAAQDLADPEMTAVAAESTALSSDEFQKLLRTGRLDVRVAVAGNRRATPALLTRLSRSTRPAVRAAVAANTSSPGALLQRLAADRSSRSATPFAATLLPTSTRARWSCSPADSSSPAVPAVPAAPARRTRRSREHNRGLSVRLRGPRGRGGGPGARGLWGPPGQGKTSAVRAVAEHSQRHLEVLLASIREPQDFAGLPSIADGRAVARRTRTGRYASRRPATASCSPTR